MHQVGGPLIINGERQYIMFDLFPLTNDIWYWDNVVSSPLELTSLIEDLDNQEKSFSRIPKWNIWTASDDQNILYGYKKEIFLKNLETKSSDELINKKTLYVINSLKMAIDMCFERYISYHGLNKDDYYLEDSILPIKKWNVGMSMGPHCDNFDGHSNLAFSMVLYLNDEYEGGEINFPNHSITVKPKAGSLIMFPSTQPFLHQVLPIKSGSRYMLPMSVFKK